MKELDFKQIGQRIRERRVACKLTQEYVANHLEVNPSHISNIECARANPSLTALVNIANILECSADMFLSGEYTFSPKVLDEPAIDEKIKDRLLLCDVATKEKLLRIMEIL